MSCKRTEIKGMKMRDYEIVIGLEIHVELNTKSKIYCSCQNVFGREPNTNICPVCMGLPGTLPTLNKKAVDCGIKMGHALNCRINSVSRQARKNYFYPDLPKAYQISQADIPLCENGYLDIIFDGFQRRIGITRIHIEEDAGKLIHDESTENSLIDLNRCGVPLIEIVTDPDIRSSSEAKTFLDTIKSILKYIDISDCKMQEGSIRCDVNLSVREKGSCTYGTRCEMKNVNSFSAVVRAIDYESKRQMKIIESGGEIAQETRRWDDIKGRSFIMRTKEDVQDYRYFPEPDLGLIVIEEEHIQELKQLIPELPNEKIFRYMKEHGMSYIDAVLIAGDIDKAKFYDECIVLGECSPKSIINWILGDISKYTNSKGCLISETKLTAQRLVDLAELVENNLISNSAAKTVLEIILEDDREPAEIVKEKGLLQNSDTQQLEELADKVLKSNEKSVSDYKNGKTNALGYIVGQCMKESKGKANPKIIRSIVERKINE